MINPFPTIHPVYLIYFFGGAAFLFLGFSIGTKNMTGSNLRIADSLWMLAIFGLLHGLREWVEIYPLLEGEHLSKDQIFAVAVISGILLIILGFDLRSWLQNVDRAANEMTQGAA